MERALGLHPADRQELPGLYRLNVEKSPRLRILGFQAVIAFAFLHNVVLGVGVGWRAFIAVGLILEAYAFGQRWVLQRYFTRVRRVHLGTLFLVLDLVAFSLAVWATGAHRSWLWPIYLVRVADQMWIGRRRAALMGAAALASYAGLLALIALGQGVAVPWSSELLKLAIMGALAGYLILSAGLPWNLQARTQAAKELILRLERQSMELDEERARAEEASRTKSEFLAQMSHELRTPLNSVVGFARLLLRDDEKAGPPSKVPGYAQRIYDNAVHLLQVISDILEIARLQEGSVEMRPSRLDLEALAREVVSELEERARPGVRVLLSFPRTLEPVDADRARLHQVLVNLVDNALKFTHEGWVRVEVLAEPGSGQARELRVVDTGVGIEAEHLDAVFEPFQQVHAGLDRPYEGTGLGLAIAHALCELMGFTLEARSAPGEGSTFSVVFRSPDGEAAHTEAGGDGLEKARDGEGGRPAPRNAPLGPDDPEISREAPRPG